MLDVPPSESDEPLVPANDLSSSSMNRIAGKSIPLFSRRYADLPLSVPPLNHHRPVPYLTATAVDLAGCRFGNQRFTTTGYSQN